MAAKIELTKQSQRLLKRVAKTGKIDLRPILNQIGNSYRIEVKGIFQKQQRRSPDKAWKELSEPYATIKSRKYPGAPILVRTGRLKRSMTKKNAEGNISIITKFAAIFGSTVDYAAYHDEGTGKIPQRNFSEPSDRRLTIFKRILNNDMVKQIERKGIKVMKELIL